MSHYESISSSPKLLGALAIAAIAGVLIAPNAHAQIIITPEDSIQEAIEQLIASSPPETTIILTEGVYTDSFSISSNRLFIIRAAVGAEVVIQAPMRSRIFSIINNSSSVNFENIIFSDGAPLPDMNNMNRGGAGYITHSIVSFRDCAFISNTCSASGSGASGLAVGGALFVQNTSLHLERCALIGNVATGAADTGASGSREAHGGAVAAVNSSITMIDCELRDNVAGVIASEGASILGSAQGGALRLLVSSLNISNCIIENNVAETVSNASPNSFLMSDGGAVYAYSSVPGFSLNVSNSLVADNRAISVNDASGGAVWTGVPITVFQSTFANNWTSGKGGGIRLNNVQATVSNSIFALNEDALDAPNIDGGVNSGGYNLFGSTRGIGVGDLADSDLTWTDPLFADADGGDYRLSPGSPAIDRADTTLVFDAGLMRDLAGALRAVPSPDATGGGVYVMTPVGLAAADIGAYELQPPAPPASTCIADLSGDGLVGSADLAMMLGAWGPCP